VVLPVYVEVYVENLLRKPAGRVDVVSQMFITVEHGRHLLEIDEVPPFLSAENLQVVHCIITKICAR